MKKMEFYHKLQFPKDEISKTNNPRKVILNMLKTRKYHIEDPENFLNSNTEIFLFNKIENDDDKIYVFFPQASNKVGVITIRKYITEMQENKINHAIIVVKDSITHFAKQVFSEAKSLTIEHFRENELYIDKLSHVLVPKHELLSEEEEKELFKTYKIKGIHLPKILSSDPISRYFGAKKGNIFKITRPSETSGEYIYYRIVI